jgi:hypothetical protein
VQLSLITIEYESYNYNVIKLICTNKDREEAKINERHFFVLK